ncbi:sperm-associated antigen 6 [Puma concolor]|uniref:Sperm-associated antigen 6 n=1 Tax=Puma concolor TaxID=9696 RepID=A0A6P6IG61_PUMCO|nr:sperm-associated antigen 6 [Puma concolor]
MSQRQVLQVFEQYQKARTQFVQMVAELATRPQNIETLQNAGVMSLLRPLLLDVVPTIQQTAALALGRLANYNGDLAEAVVKGDILPQLVYSLAEQNRFYKKAAAFVLRAVGKHSPQLAQAIVDCGALDTLVICLEDFDPGVKEAAAWALGYIARHNAGRPRFPAPPWRPLSGLLTVQQLRGEELPVTSCPGCGSSEGGTWDRGESNSLAASAIDTYTGARLSTDAGQGRRSLSSRGSRAVTRRNNRYTHNRAAPTRPLCVPPSVPCSLNYGRQSALRYKVASASDDFAQPEANLSQLIVNTGGVAAVTDCIGSCKGNIRLPGIMMLGYVAAHSENLAMAVIVSKAVPQLSVCLCEEPEDHIKAAAAWALGQIGRHTPEHARAVAVTNTLPVLLSLYMSTESSEDLQTKSKKAIKSILQKCTYLPALEPFLYDAPPNILKHVVGQFSKVLPHDSKARRLFVTSGGLKKVQEIKAGPGSLLQEYINSINSCYPEEIVRYYSPGYSDALLQRVDSYQPLAN